MTGTIQAVGSVSRACRVMDYNRANSCWFKKLYHTGGELALEISRRFSRPVVPAGGSA